MEIRIVVINQISLLLVDMRKEVSCGLSWQYAGNNEGWWHLQRTAEMGICAAAAQSNGIGVGGSGAGAWTSEHSEPDSSFEGYCQHITPATQFGFFGLDLLFLCVLEYHLIATYRFWTIMDVKEPLLPSDPPPSYEDARKSPLPHNRSPSGAPLAKRPPPGPPPPLNLPALNELRGSRVVLASASPRRRQLLAQVRGPLLGHAHQMLIPSRLVSQKST
jgi:hypothetical protein